MIRWWVECDGGWGNWKINLRRGRRFDGLETSTIGRPWWNTHYIFAKCTLTLKREVCKISNYPVKWFCRFRRIFNSTSIPLLQDENVTCGGFKDVDFHYFAKVATNPIELVNFEGSSHCTLHWFSSEPVKIGQWAKIDGISTSAPGLKKG